MSVPAPKSADLPRVFLADGFCCVEFSPSSRVDLAFAQYVYHERLKLLREGEQRHRILVTANRALSFDFSASRFSVSPLVTRSIVACAVISQSALERNIAALFSHMFKPPYPFRLFANRDAAITWLSSFPEH